MLIKHGIIASEKSLEIACENGYGSILILLINLGFKLTRAYNVLCCPNYRELEKVYMVYHQFGSKGRYQQRCLKGLCLLCHVVEIGKLWELEEIDNGLDKENNNIRYTNYIQFLPRELVEDLQELIADY